MYDAAAHSMPWFQHATATIAVRCSARCTLRKRGARGAGWSKPLALASLDLRHDGAAGGGGGAAKGELLLQAPLPASSGTPVPSSLPMALGGDGTPYMGTILV